MITVINNSMVNWKTILTAGGRQVSSSRIDLPDDQHTREVEEEYYKYSGVLPLDKTLNTKMKGEITSEYVRRVKKLCRMEEI